MLSAGYFHPYLSRVAASVVGIDNDREGQRSGYQLPPVARQNSIKIGSFLREQKFATSSKLQSLRQSFRYIFIFQKKNHNPYVFEFIAPLRTEQPQIIYHLHTNIEFLHLNEISMLLQNESN
jgi:hypothetical protein